MHDSMHNEKRSAIGLRPATLSPPGPSCGHAKCCPPTKSWHAKWPSTIRRSTFSSSTSKVCWSLERLFRDGFRRALNPQLRRPIEQRSGGHLAGTKKEGRSDESTGRRADDKTDARRCRLCRVCRYRVGRPPHRTMAGKAVTAAGVLGRGTRAWGWSGVLGPGAVLLMNDNILYHT